MKFSAQLVTTALPLCRNEHLVEVLQGAQGLVDQCWLYSGHVFVSLNGGTSLTTADCICASQQQLPQLSPLELKDLDSPVMDVQLLFETPQLFAIILSSGAVLCWRFRISQWEHVTSYNICSSDSVLLFSICFHSGHGCVYWCESPDQNKPGGHAVCVYRRRWPQETLERENPGPAEAVILSCLPSTLLAMGNFLLVVCRPETGQVQICLVLDGNQGKVHLIVGDVEVDVPCLNSDAPLDFQDVIKNCMPSFLQTKSWGHFLGASQDPVQAIAVTLTSTGHMQVFFQTDCEQSLQMRALELQGVKDAAEASAHFSGDNWFVSQGLLGLLTPATLRVYSVKDGAFCGELQWPGGASPRQLVRTNSLVVLAGFVTSCQLYQIQNCGEILEGEKDGKSLPAQWHFQTEVLHLAKLVQRRNGAFSPEKVNALSVLHAAWRNGELRSNSTDLSCIVEPYVSEFWYLENLTKWLPVSGIQTGVAHPMSVLTQGRSMLLDESALPLEDQQDHLLWLCEMRPMESLESLATALELTMDSTEGLQDTPITKWERLLGREGSQSSSESTLRIYEHLCRLLFKLKPGLLISFVSAAQAAVQRSVGVSAFIRKKHMNQCYLRALECLPEPHTSVNPHLAATATAQLLLACSEKQGNLKALKFLLQNGYWHPALELTQQQFQTASTHSSYLLYLTLISIAQHGVLAEFSKEIFPMVPTWERFLSLCGALEEQTEVQQGQLTTYLHDIFAHDATLSIGALHPFLWRLTSTVDAHTDRCRTDAV